jgi:hypothetical protein
MFLAERLELDVDNRGNRLIAWIVALRKLVARYVPDHPPPVPLLRDSADQNGCGQSDGYRMLHLRNSGYGPEPYRLAAASRRLRKGTWKRKHKVQGLATQRATKRSSFDSLRLRHIC